MYVSKYERVWFKPVIIYICMRMSLSASKVFVHLVVFDVVKKLTI